MRMSATLGMTCLMTLSLLTLGCGGAEGAEGMTEPEAVEEVTQSVTTYRYSFTCASGGSGTVTTTSSNWCAGGANDWCLRYYASPVVACSRL